MQRANGWVCLIMLMSMPVAFGARLGYHDLFPKNSGVWNLGKAPITYNKTSIYDYMDGAADTYMNYAYKSLDVASYSGKSKKLIVELYDMTNNYEAYGIFSNGLNGELVRVGQGAWYDSGALNFWQRNFYGRIFEEKGASNLKADMVALAGKICKQIGVKGFLPSLVYLVPQASKKPKLIRYFHRDANLNNFYYLSTSNLLELGPKTDCALGDYPPGDRKSMKLLLIRYPDTRTRSRAWDSFTKTILTARKKKIAANLVVDSLKSRGWVGLRSLSKLDGKPGLVLCFQAKDEKQCIQFLQSVKDGHG